MADRLFRVILPKFDNSRKRISTDTLRDLATEFAEHFGGVTVFPSVLGCETFEGKLFCEENMMIESTRIGITPEQLKRDREFVAKFATKVGNTLGQGGIFTQEETDVMTSIQLGTRLETLPEGVLEVDFFKKLID